MKKEKLQQLDDLLCYLKMEELKEICIGLNLPFSGKKRELIDRVIIYLETGKIISSKKLPEKSIAEKGKNYSLHPKTKILLGSYKNDLATRNFFKSLIGKHFHFTAFGQDWIKERWRKGNPPTYQEFADFWSQEYERRKKKKKEPKKEWALICFMQRYLEKHPKAKPKETLDAWEKERKEKVKEAKEFLFDLKN